MTRSMHGAVMRVVNGITGIIEISEALALYVFS